MNQSDELTHQRINQMVQQIPPGKVATYGQIATLVGNCTARMVGYAMASLPNGSDVPWQRVINSQGKVSPRGDLGGGADYQVARLADEGVHFNAAGKVDWATVRWTGPSLDWMLENGFPPVPEYTETWQPKNQQPDERQPGLFETNE